MAEIAPLIPKPNIAQQLESLPVKTGVYLFRDRRGEVLYVGKAVSLRSRVRSYFQAAADSTPKLHRLVERVADLEVILTESELEALILECNLIKEHRPRYNVMLKDDKRYPYVKVTWQEAYPRVFATRQVARDGARCFGPYASAHSVRDTLELIRRIFPYVSCTREITGQDKRACLYHHIHRCLAPCIGAVSKEEYRAMIEEICLFLQGKHEEILADLRRRMEEAAARLEFERATSLREQIWAVQRVMEQQKVVSAALADQDVIALARADGSACAQVFFIRRGKLIGRENFLLEGTKEEEAREIMTSFVKQFYNRATYIPQELILENEIDEALIIERWLRERRGTKVTIIIPRRGRKKRLVEMVAQNAAETLNQMRREWLADQRRRLEALNELKERLGLPALPKHIECYDISNIQGRAATGSMVVFIGAKSRPSHYRRFRIRGVPGADDYAMLQEVLKRRLNRATSEDDATSSWKRLPELIIIDGGKGQLSAAMETLGETKGVAVIALAKEREEIFQPGKAEPLTLPEGSAARHLVQNIRDEAHRFALAYHRHLRQKEGLASALDDVPGIGPKRKRALLNHFGTVARIRKASLEELTSVAGMDRATAQSIKEYL